MTTANPRVALGDNKPPLEPAESLEKRLDLEQAALIGEAAALDVEFFKLPPDPATDEECAAVSGHVAKIKALNKKLEDARTTTGRPYLEANRVINGWFKEMTDPLALTADGLTKKVAAYARAKGEREAAERRQREAAERAAAEAARAEEQRQRAAADAAARSAEEAAARIRQAATPEARGEAETQMRQAEAQAGELREAAEASGKTAAQAERKADGHERAAGGDLTRLSRVAGATATASVSKVWAYTITDARKLLATLGPLAPYLSEMTISDAVARAVREQSQGGARPTIVLPGVDIFQTDRANIRAARSS